MYVFIFVIGEHEGAKEVLQLLGGKCQTSEMLSQKPSVVQLQNERRSQQNFSLQQNLEIDRILLGNSVGVRAWEPTESQIKEQLRQAKKDKNRETDTAKEKKRLKKLLKKGGSTFEPLPPIDGHLNTGLVAWSMPENFHEKLKKSKKSKSKASERVRMENPKKTTKVDFEERKRFTDEYLIAKECDTDNRHLQWVAGNAVRQEVYMGAAAAAEKAARKAKKKQAKRNNKSASVGVEEQGYFQVAEVVQSTERRRNKYKKSNKVGVAVEEPCLTQEENNDRHWQWTGEQLELYHPRNRPTSRERPYARGDTPQIIPMETAVPMSPSDIRRNKIAGNCCNYHAYLVKLHKFNMKNLTSEERRLEEKNSLRRLLREQCSHGDFAMFHQKQQAERRRRQSERVKEIIRLATFTAERKARESAQRQRGNTVMVQPPNSCVEEDQVRVCLTLLLIIMNTCRHFI